jgi:hypothetical protein
MSNLRCLIIIILLASLSPVRVDLAFSLHLRQSSLLPHLRRQQQRLLIWRWPLSGDDNQTVDAPLPEAADIREFRLAQVSGYRKQPTWRVTSNNYVGKENPYTKCCR